MHSYNISHKSCVIFDMDGCLVDTESTYIKVWELAFRKHAVDMPLEKIQSWTGLGWGKIKVRILKDYPALHNLDEIRAEREQRFYDALYQGKIALKPYVKEFIQKLKEHGFMLGVGTSTFKEKGDQVLSYFELDQCFDFVVYGDEVEDTKPAPDIFNRCFELSGKRKEDIVIFEDSLNGLKAANNAGIDVVFVPDFRYYSCKEAHYITAIQSFKDVSFEVA